MIPLPSTLSPSKVSSFKSCPLAFRYSAIERLPEAPSAATARGTLVHRALERLFWHEPAGARTPAAALAHLELAKPEVLGDPEYADLQLSDDEWASFFAESERLVTRYFELEDPNAVTVIGTELMLEAEIHNPGGAPLRLRGIIDRLDIDADGELVVTDYKTGRAPSQRFEQSQMGGVHFYAFLCQAVFGRRPARIQLLHLQEPVAISTVPSEQSVRGLSQRAGAIWVAVTRACDTGNFPANPGPLCDWCSFRAFCPAQGGDPALGQAAIDAARAERDSRTTEGLAAAV